MFLQPANFSFITLAAIGAQLPFSIIATVLFWKFLSAKCSKNSLMNGKIEVLYVVVAKTILPYLNASSTHSAISLLAKSLTTTFGAPLALIVSANKLTAAFVFP